MSRINTIRQLFSFLRREKKWWLYPIIILLLLLAVIMITGEGSVIGGLIYSVF